MVAKNISILVNEIVITNDIFYKIADNMEELPPNRQNLLNLLKG